MKIPVPDDLKNKKVLNTEEIAQPTELGKGYMNITTSLRIQNGLLNQVTYLWYNQDQ